MKKMPICKDCIRKLEESGLHCDHNIILEERKADDWDILKTTLEKSNLLNSRGMVNFFHLSAADLESISITILRDAIGSQWDIFLNKDGTWHLD